MKLLVDQPVSPILAEWLRSAGHDAIPVRDRGLSSASDQALFHLAASEGRVIVTSDLDFSRILALGAHSGPGLILLRGGNVTDSEMPRMLQQVVARVPESDIVRSICVVDSPAGWRRCPSGALRHDAIG